MKVYGTTVTVRQLFLLWEDFHAYSNVRLYRNKRNALRGKPIWEGLYLEMPEELRDMKLDGFWRDLETIIIYMEE